MKKPVICMICGSRPAVNTCSSCGRVVCEEHFDHQTGLCTGCSRGKRARLDKPGLLK